MRSGVILIDHGSRRENANENLEELATTLQSLFEGDEEERVVEPAHMELARPTLQEAFERCVVRGAKSIVVVPCMISRGRHLTEDVPSLLEQAGSVHPEIPYALAAPLSEHPGFVALLRDIASSAEQGSFKM